MPQEKKIYRKCGKMLTTDKSRQMEYRPSLYYSFNFFVILKLFKNQKKKKKKKNQQKSVGWDFPGRPVGKTLGGQIRSPVGELDPACCN